MGRPINQLAYHITDEAYGAKSLDMPVEKGGGVEHFYWCNHRDGIIAYRRVSIRVFFYILKLAKTSGTAEIGGSYYLHMTGQRYRMDRCYSQLSVKL